MPTAAISSALPNDRLRRLNTHFPLADCIADPQGRFVLCAIPKNGCTAIKRWFLSIVEPDKPTDLEAHRRCRDRYALVLRSPGEQSRLLAESPCIAFLRDPVRRLASAFADKFVRLAPSGCFEGARELMEEVARRRGIDVRFDTTHPVELAGRVVRVPGSSAVDYARGLTFCEFVTVVCSLPNEALDPHWRPQKAFLQPHDGSRLTLAPVQSLAATLNRLAERFGLPAERVNDQAMTADTPSLESPWIGALADAPSGTLAAREGGLPGAAALYDRALLQAVQDRYAADWALWLSLRPEAASGLYGQPS
ncbi:MAG: sulfotransferase family 2 domain-containing protein [Phycisphaeraceae bacterium]|nr:sulfotransferase family 2 domain-containing protein [Phycisphaeraceae bacterium]